MNFKRQAIKTSFWGLLLGFSPLTHATLTAVFPPSVRPRAAVWLDQSRIFTTENSSQKSRPIWIHGGDSLASAWSNGSSLRQKIARGDKNPLPEPRTLPDVIESFPNPATTWYAGSRFGFGLLGALERHFQTPWVIVSTAIAGSLLVPDQSRVDSPSGNPFQHMMDTQNPDRVRLITFSLGNNDICDGHNPLAEHTQRIREDLARLRRTFPQATILPFQVIPVHAISRSIFAELEALPPSPGKTRVIEYCRKMWEEVCPSALESSQPDAWAKDLNDFYAQELGTQPFDALGSVQTANVIDLLAGDCFHPSYITEEKLVPPLADKLIPLIRP